VQSYENIHVYDEKRPIEYKVTCVQRRQSHSVVTTLRS